MLRARIYLELVLSTRIYVHGFAMLLRSIIKPIKFYANFQLRVIMLEDVEVKNVL